MLDPAKSDHPLPTVGVVAQTPCDVAANLNLHCGLAEVDIAVVAQLKRITSSTIPEAAPYREEKIPRSEAICEVAEDRQRGAVQRVSWRDARRSKVGGDSLLLWSRCVEFTAGCIQPPPDRQLSQRLVPRVSTRKTGGNWGICSCCLGLAELPDVRMRPDQSALARLAELQPATIQAGSNHRSAAPS